MQASEHAVSQAKKNQYPAEFLKRKVRGSSVSPSLLEKVVFALWKFMRRLCCL